MAAIAVVVFAGEIFSIWGCVWNWMRCHVGMPCVVVIVLIAIIAFFVELLYTCYPCTKKKRVDGDNKQPQDTFLYDIPTSVDKLGRENSARLLVEKILDTFYYQDTRPAKIESSFVIHIGENYGMGKTSFLLLMEKALRKQKRDYIFMDFKAWLCDNEQSILKEFFQQFKETLYPHAHELNDDINNYLKLLLSSISVNMPVSGVSISINGNLFTQRAHGTLKSLHDGISKSLQDIDCPVIITVDDVDRLRQEELMMVLKIIRDTADFPNVFYIVAADSDFLTEALTNMGINSPAQYLEKFFNMEYLLPANEDVAYNFLIKKLEKRYKSDWMGSDERDALMAKIEGIDHLRDAFKTLRQVKRFLNEYFLTLDLIGRSQTEKLDSFNLFLLSLVKYFCPELYLLLRDDFNMLLEVRPIANETDSVLVIKGQININGLRMNSLVKEVIQEIIRRRKAKDGDNKTDNEEKIIPEFEEVVIIAMDMMFGNDKNVHENEIRRVNKFYTYFCGEQASYMVSRLELLTLLFQPEQTYINRLNEMFKQDNGRYSKYDSLLGEFTYIVDSDEWNEAEMLRRLFYFFEVGYKIKVNISSAYYTSVTEYISNVYQLQLSGIAIRLYSSHRERTPSQVDEARREFVNLFREFKALGFLIFVRTIFAGYYQNIVLTDEELKETLEILRDRLFDECVKSTCGMVNEDTIACMSLLSRDVAWRKKLQDYLKTDDNACMNMLSLLVGQAPDGSFYWRENMIKALFNTTKVVDMSFLDTLACAHTKHASLINDLKTLLGNRNGNMINNNDNNSQFLTFAVAQQANR